MPKPKSRRQLATTKPPEKPSEQQLDDVFQWLINGGTEFQIREAFATKYDGADAMPAVALMIDKIRESAEFDAEIMKGWCFEAYREIYRRMMEAADYAGAIRAVEKIHAMTGTP